MPKTLIALLCLAPSGLFLVGVAVTQLIRIARKRGRR